jgi:hypothetical protein
VIFLLAPCRGAPILGRYYIPLTANRGSVMALKVDVSVGEFLDKRTILEIKSERIKSEDKLRNVNRELLLLRETWASSTLSAVDTGDLVPRLKAVNERLWDIEDNIRRQESAGTFGEEFIRLARSVYEENDERASLKYELNQRLGSDLVEEKEYPDYTGPSS